MSSYAPHIGPVYGVKVNPYSDRVFATCSADWTIRVFLDDARAGGDDDDEDDIFASLKIRVRDYRVESRCSRDA